MSQLHIPRVLILLFMSIEQYQLVIITPSRGIKIFWWHCLMSHSQTHPTASDGKGLVKAYTSIFAILVVGWVWLYVSPIYTYTYTHITYTPESLPLLLNLYTHCRNLVIVWKANLVHQEHYEFCLYLLYWTLVLSIKVTSHLHFLWPSVHWQVIL